MANPYSAILWKHSNDAYEEFLVRKNMYIITVYGENKIQILIYYVILAK